MKVDISKILWKSHILIIDYNTLHYTSFDTFRMMLLNAPLAKVLRPEYRSFFRMSIDEQLKFFFMHQTHRDLYQLFTVDAQKEFPMNMYDLLDTYHTFPAHIYTDTDLNRLMRTALQHNTIETVSILRHPSDMSPLHVPDDCKIYRTKGLFNATAISKFIENYHVNAVILDSVDLAMEISEQTERCVFLIGTYQYNFDFDTEQDLRFMRHMDNMNRYEWKKHHEYGRFDPILKLYLPDNKEESTDGR